MPSSNTAPDVSTDLIDPATTTDRTVYQTPLYYQCLISVLKPLYRLQVWRRSSQRDNYQQEVEQRFGKQYPPRPLTNTDYDKGIIWCHAVSLGETNTVAPLLDALLADGYQVWLTNTTQTGFARGASRFATEIEQGQMSHSYVPVDSPAVIEKFLAHVQPVAALFVETELWANILTILCDKRIPSILVNGRLSLSSFQRYQKIGAVSTSMMKNLAVIIAQDSDSAKRYRQLGASSAQIRVAGSLKWVINTPKVSNKATESDAEHESIEAQKDKLKKAFSIAGRPVWVAASTHQGEEETALLWHQQLLAQSALKDALLIIVPRHPERFEAVAELIQKTELNMTQRSTEVPIDADTQVYLADSMGEMMTWYQLADVALVGGSLVDIGGHNPVEATSVATPVLMGRYTQSCQTVVDKLAEVGALYQPHNPSYRPVQLDPLSHVDEYSTESSQQATKPRSGKRASSTDDADLYQQLAVWLTDLALAAQAGLAGKQVTVQQQAVLSRQFAMIKDVIEQRVDQEGL